MGRRRITSDGRVRAVTSGMERITAGAGHVAQGDMDLALDINTEPMLVQDLDGVVLDGPVRASCGGSPEVRLYLMEGVLVADPIPLTGDWMLQAWDPGREDDAVTVRLISWTPANDGTYPYLSGRMDLSALADMFDETCAERWALKAQVVFRDGTDPTDVRHSEIFDMELLECMRPLDWVTPVNEWSA